MQLAGKIKDLSEKYRSYTAEVLGKMIRVPGFSGKEKDRCEVIVKLCREAGFDEVYIDGLGSVVGRVGHGPKKLAFDAHIDTVEVGTGPSGRQTHLAGTLRRTVWYMVWVPRTSWGEPHA